MSKMFAKKKLLVAKIEPNYGVDSLPTGDDAIETSNLSIQILEGDKVEANVDRPELGNYEQHHVASHAKVSFDTYIRGAGSAGDVPQVGVLLRACAMKQVIDPGVSVEYLPVSSAFESATLKYNIDGEEYALLGARGEVKFELSAKGLPMFKFEFTGLSLPGAVAPAPAKDFSGLQKVRSVEKSRTSFSIGAYNAVMHSFSGGLNNAVVHRNLVNEESVLITDRKPSANIKIDRPRQAQWDFESDIRGNVFKAVTLTHDTQAGRIFEVSLPKCQVLSPSFGSENDIATLDLELGMLPTSAGDDEIKFTFK